MILYNKKINFLQVLTFIYCCTGTKPIWINNLEDNTQYFQGIGRVSIEDINYRQKAFQAAESEIARQLNVDIKGSSTRNKVIDLSKTVEDRYTASVQTNIQQTLKDVTKIDEYQDKDNFYLLLGLDKQKYLEQKRKEKEQALDEIQTIIGRMHSLDVVEKFVDLNRALGIIINKDLLYEQNSNDDFIYTKIETDLGQLINKLSLEMDHSTILYNPLLENKLSVPVKINYDGKLSASLPISLYLDKNIVGKTLSSEKSITEVIIEPEGYNDQVVSITIDKDIFGADKNIYVDHNIELGSFVVRPVIGDLKINVTGPLSKNQKGRLSNRVEQFLLSKFEHDDKNKMVMDVSIIIERDDKPRYAENFPNVSFSSGSIIVSNGSMKNVFKIKKFKGSDFNNVDQAFDRSINKLCEHSNLSVIFQN